MADSLSRQFLRVRRRQEQEGGCSIAVNAAEYETTASSASRDKSRTACGARQAFQLVAGGRTTTPDCRPRRISPEHEGGYLPSWPASTTRRSLEWPHGFAIRDLGRVRAVCRPPGSGRDCGGGHVLRRSRAAVQPTTRRWGVRRGGLGLVGVRRVGMVLPRTGLQHSRRPVHHCAGAHRVNAVGVARCPWRGAMGLSASITQPRPADVGRAATMDEPNRRWFRRGVRAIRGVVSIACLVACIGFAALWVRSYYLYDSLFAWRPGQYVGVQLQTGRVRFITSARPPGHPEKSPLTRSSISADDSEKARRSVAARGQIREVPTSWGFGYLRFATDTYGLIIPHWFLVIASGGLAVVLKPKPDCDSACATCLSP